MFAMDMGNDTMTVTERMIMTFEDSHEFTVLFDDWEADTDTEYAWGIVAIFISAMMVQCLRFIMEQLNNRMNHNIKEFEMKDWLLGLAYGCTFFCWVALGYILMLIVMTYNEGIFWAITTGGALGYGIFHVFLYSPKKKLVSPEY